MQMMVGNKVMQMPNKMLTDSNHKTLQIIQPYNTMGICTTNEEASKLASSEPAGKTAGARVPAMIARSI